MSTHDEVVALAFTLDEWALIGGALLNGAADPLGTTPEDREQAMDLAVRIMAALVEHPVPDIT